MSTRWYPLYQRGNPQLRVFLPNFWMKLVEGKQKQLPNVVTFQVSMEMSKYDVKNYLEKIYKIPVVDVTTEIHTGEFKRQVLRGYVVKDEDFKLAYVSLPREEKFEFPNVFPKDKTELMKKEMKTLDDAKKGFAKYEVRNKHRPGLPGWFSI